MNKSILLISVYCVLAITAISFFEFHPMVKEAQSFVSLENYENKDVSCFEILNGRPWYGRFNHWFWLWITCVPLLVFSVKPDAPKWQRALRTIMAVGFCYGLMNLAMHLSWDLSNELFRQAPYNPDPANGWRMDCHKYGTGFSYILAIGFAWIPAALYTGFWFFIWSRFHKWRGQITKEFKQDIVNRLFGIALKIYGLVVLIFLASLLAFLLFSYFFEEPFNPGYFGLMGFLIVRPLLIPFEIFMH